MRTKYLFLSLLWLIGTACSDGINLTELENTSSKIYLATSGYTTYSLLDFGEGSKTFELYVNKSGFSDRKAEVSFVYDPSAVDDYLSTSSEEINILPETIAQFENEQVVMEKEQTLSKTKLVINMGMLREQIQQFPDKKQVYPIRISSSSDENVQINENKDYILIAIDLLTPYVSLKNSGKIVDVFIDVFRNPGLTETRIPLTLSLPFQNTGYTFNFEIKTDPELVTAYNTKYGTNYAILPQGYELPKISMAGDETQVSKDIRIVISSLPQSIGGKTYILPIKITSSGNESIPMEENSICYFKIKQIAKWSGAWSNYIHAEESGLSTAPETTYETFLYSRNDALELFAESTLVAALANITDEEAIVCPGWAGTLFEQCSPIIKVTDKDAGNGKKVVEILAGWAREGAGWEPLSTANNKSTYDPGKNEIYLDYTGKFSWGDYHIQRTFKNQVVSY